MTPRRRTCLATALLIAGFLRAGSVAAEAARGLDAVPEKCLYDAAYEYQLPIDALRLILLVEGGQVGACSQNANGTRDCGPGQINSIWFPRIAAGRVDPQVIERAITNDACYNIRIAGWILGQEIKAVGWSNFWQGVGNYHSRTPEFHQRYLSKIVDAARRLAARRAKEVASAR